MFKTLLKKEFIEQIRTYKILIILAVFLITGLISPMLAKYTPVILASVPDLPPGFSDLVPEPTIQDAVGQYVKNISQFGILLVILLNMGTIAQEKERGTLAMILTKPLRPSWVVLAKWLSSVSVLLLGLLVAGIGCAVYTMVLFQPLPSGDFLVLNGLIALYLIVFLTLAILGSTLARSQVMGAAISFGLLAAVLVIGAFPRLGDYMPGALTDWGIRLMVGEQNTAWGALAISLGITALSLLSACVFIEKRELR